jgi:hypothetical protein
LPGQQAQGKGVSSGKMSIADIVQGWSDDMLLKNTSGILSKVTQQASAVSPP